MAEEMEGAGISRLEPGDRLALEAMLRAPERVEVHGSDRRWRGFFLGAVMSAAALSFGPARADSTVHLQQIPVERSQPGMARTRADVADLVRQIGVEQIAGATRSTQVSAFPFTYSAEWSGADLSAWVASFVKTTPGLLAPVNGGLERTGSYLASIAQRATVPVAWAYASKSADHTGCVILVSDRLVPELEAMPEVAGIDRETAEAFVVGHEAAHCAQYSETIAALRDLQILGKVRPERLRSNLLDVHFERLLAAGASYSQLSVMSVARQRASERYADGFSVLALMARGRLTTDQLLGIAKWRSVTSTAHGHGTASFLVSLHDELAANPELIAGMRSASGPGFDAGAIAEFLKPRWKGFERGELAADEPAASRPAPTPREKVGLMANLTPRIGAPMARASSTVFPMTTNTQRLTDQDRVAIEQLLRAPEVMEIHGEDLQWQKALVEATTPAAPKISLRDALGFGERPAVEPDRPRGA